MAKTNSFSDRVRFVYARSPILLKCAVLVTLVVCIGALTVLRIGIDQYQNETNILRAQAAQIQNENDKQEALIQGKDTVDGIKAIAQEKLDMVDGDTVVYEIVSNQN